MKETTLAMSGSAPRIAFTCVWRSRHRLVAHVLRSLAEPDEQPVVLLGKEALRDPTKRKTVRPTAPSTTPSISHAWASTARSVRS